MEELKVENVVISKQGEDSDNYSKFKKIVDEKKINVIEVKKGDLINIEKDLKIRILFPTENLITDNVLNNNSIVVRLEYKKFSMLFTGDIEKKAEQEILKLYKNTDYLKSTILKVAHHGSKTSSTIEFLNEVKPKIALIGVGLNNKFGHPNDITIENLKSIGTSIYRTDIMGEICIEITKNGIIKIKGLICDY